MEIIGSCLAFQFFKRFYIVRYDARLDVVIIVGNGINGKENVLVFKLQQLSSVFYIFLLRQNFMQIPNELYLAAMVDGTKDLKYLT